MHLPTCWDTVNYEYYQEKVEGLVARNKKLYCTVCIDAKLPDKSNNWTKAGVAAPNLAVRKAKKKLTDKIDKHFTSQTHLKSLEILKLRDKSILKEFILETRKDQATSTGRLFSIAYYIANTNRPFDDFPKLIDLIQTFGIDLGYSLHDRKTCKRMIQTISNHFRSRLSQQINSSGKFAIILDESDTIGNEPALIVYIKTVIQNRPTTLFIDLVKLEHKDANSVYSAITKALNTFGIPMAKIRNDLIQVVSDGASVFVGKKSGVGIKFLQLNKSIVIWHCLCHRLELSISQAKSSMTQFKNFQDVLNEIYKFYSTSSKNTNEIKEISSELDRKFKKIGKIFTIRWSASSYKTVCAVLNNLEALRTHFQSKMILTKDKEKKEKLKFVLNALRSKSFGKNLRIMEESLKELTSLSCRLQQKNMNLVDAHKIIMHAIQILKAKSENAETETDPEVIDEKLFYQELAKSIKQKSIATAYRENMTNDEKKQRLEQYLQSLKKLMLVDKESWPKNTDIVYGEDLIPIICKDWHLDEIKLLNQFRDFKLLGKIGDEFQKLINISNTFCVSSADAERGFSSMNLILTDIRNRLKIETTSDLMTVRSINMPVSNFNPTVCVKIWLTSHHNADSAKNTSRKPDKDEEENKEFYFLYDTLNH